MKLPNLTIASLFSVLIQGCLPAIYIPPATREMPKTEMVHVSRANSSHLYIVKINGITVIDPFAGGGVKPKDFYVVPGTYSVDLGTYASAVGLGFGSSMFPVDRSTGGLTIGDTATVLVSPAQAGKTMEDPEFLRTSDFIPHATTSDYLNRGIAKQGKGDLDGAIADYNRAIKLNPYSADAYNNRGDAKQAKGDLDGANADHAKAIQLKSNVSK